uniref:Uncharacterized protein n=1 Tax=Rhizophora mucronata TaxID=61149 RepID=A0A2P2IT70_RHIMU
MEMNPCLCFMKIRRLLHMSCLGKKALSNEPWHWGVIFKIHWL